MKKILYFAMTALALGFGFTACDVETDEEAGGTNVQNLAGHWEVTADLYDTAGNLLAADIMGGTKYLPSLGRSKIGCICIYQRKRSRI